MVAGLLTPIVAAATAVVLVGAAAYVHVLDGTGTRGGWQLVGAIVVALAALATAGPGRFSLPHLVRGRRARTASPPVAPRGSRHEPHEFFDGPIPPAGLPLVPLVRLTPASMRDQSPGPVE